MDHGLRIMVGLAAERDVGYLNNTPDLSNIELPVLPRLQNLAGGRPLLITELGLDSLRNGPEAQAAIVETQVRAAFAWGTAGVFVYAWTDEWHRARASIISRT